MLDVVGGTEWAVIGMAVGTTIVCLWLVIRVQGDMLIRTHPDVRNDDLQAADLMVKLINQTKDSIVIHDDGNDSAMSVYNNAKVVDAFRRRIDERGIKVRCLFNDQDQLRLLTLLNDAPDNVDIMYAYERPPNDIHYKIVDGGKYVHLSRHEHGASERRYTLHTAKWATRSARRRVSQPYLEHFERGCQDAEAATPASH